MTPESKPTIFTLSAITRRIQQLLAEATLKSFWVRAEISSGRHKGGSFYGDFIESDSTGRVAARLRCTIWASDLKRIQQRFAAQNMTLQLDDGNAVIVCCQLQYSPQYGISLKVIDADPAFALGELEQRKRQILEGLQRDGLLDLNRQLALPAVPMTIGLITSGNSAACADFIQTLSLSGYRFRVIIADSVVQGTATESSVLRSLEILSHRRCDLVALVRGGGSQTDLSWLDNDAIARRIAYYPKPVWTGIGHEIDHSVLDQVAHRAFKTPTAVAEELVGRCVQADCYLDETAERFRTIWSYRLQQDQQWLERSVVGLHNGVRKMLDLARSELREAALSPWTKVSDRLSQERLSLSRKGLNLEQANHNRLQGESTRLKETSERLRVLSRQRIERAEHRLSLTRQSFRLNRLLQRISSEENSLTAKLATVYAHDPQRVVRRGFALVQDATGTILTKTSQTQPDQSLTLTMSDGQLDVSVQAVRQRKETHHE